jgi:hypothetical protein
MADGALTHWKSWRSATSDDASGRAIGRTHSPRDRCSQAPFAGSSDSYIRYCRPGTRASLCKISDDACGDGSEAVVSSGQACSILFHVHASGRDVGASAGRCWPGLRYGSRLPVRDDHNHCHLTVAIPSPTRSLRPIPYVTRPVACSPAPPRRDPAHRLLDATHSRLNIRATAHAARARRGRCTGMRCGWRAYG